MSNLNQHSSGRVHLSLLWRLWTQRRGATFCLVRSSPCRPQRMGNVLGSMSQKQSIQVVARDPEISFLVKSFDLNTTSQYIYVYVYVYVYTHTYYIYIYPILAMAQSDPTIRVLLPQRLSTHRWISPHPVASPAEPAPWGKLPPGSVRSEAPWNIFVCRTDTACHSFLSQTLV